MQGPAGLRIRGSLTGLAPLATGVAWHIHSGHTCATSTPASAVGGHYFPLMPVDPWTAATGAPSESASAGGVATVDYSIGGFSLHGTNPVAGRTLVVHEAGGDRAGCGLIGAPSLGAVSMGPYPGSNANVGGTLVVHSLPHASAVHIEGVVTGLSGSGGWHVHVGYTCETAADVGGHLLTADGADPWAGDDA